MSKRATNRASAGLRLRQSSFDSLRADDRQGRVRPGSQNPKKNPQEPVQRTKRR